MDCFDREEVNWGGCFGEGRIWGWINVWVELSRMSEDIERRS